MERERLNTNKFKNRVRQVSALLDDVVADQVYDLLAQAGVIELLSDAGLLDGTAASSFAAQATDLAAKAELALARGLERGDGVCIRIYEEKLARKEAQQSFQVVVNIPPYRIADATLRQIVMEADEGPVCELMDALAERSEVDGCPHGLVTQILDAREAWREWAKDGLKPRKARAES